MSETTTVPVTLPPDAAARLAELGMQREYGQMVDKLRQTVPGLFHIEVEAVDRMDGSPLGITLHAWSDQRDQTYAAHKAVNWWQVRTFPPEVLEHFLMTVHYGERHAG
jgi:hypothetical protein